jgi:hypothetical protein
MTDAEMLAALIELKDAYTALRAAWVADNGTAAGFDAWFTAQVLARA